MFDQTLMEQWALFAQRCTLILNASWLSSRADLVSHNPPRDPDGAPMASEKGTKMLRFAFVGDVYTSWDGEILNKTDLRIIYNRHQKGRYYEDGAFFDPMWSPGQIVNCKQIEVACEKYVDMSNNRPDDSTGYPPKPIELPKMTWKRTV